MSADAEVEARGPRHADKRRPRRTGDERIELRKDLAERYVGGGESIRALSSTYDLSYGLTRALLLEAGVSLRSRRGLRSATKTVEL